MYFTFETSEKKKGEKSSCRRWCSRRSVCLWAHAKALSEIKATVGSGSAKNSLHYCFLTAELSQKQMVLSRETDKYSVCFVLFCFEKRGRRIRRGVHVCVCQPIATSIGTIKKSTCRALPLFSTVMPVKKKKVRSSFKKKKRQTKKVHAQIKILWNVHCAVLQIAISYFLEK